MSTDPTDDGGHAQVWRRSPSVAVREKPFGAIAYDFSTRRLAVLKSTDLLAAVSALDGTRTAADALTAAGVPAARRPAVLRALQRLAGDGLLQPVPGQPLPGSPS